MTPNPKTDTDDEALGEAVAAALCDDATVEQARRLANHTAEAPEKTKLIRVAAQRCQHLLAVGGEVRSLSTFYLMVSLTAPCLYPQMHKRQKICDGASTSTASTVAFSAQVTPRNQSKFAWQKTKANIPAEDYASDEESEEDSWDPTQSKDTWKAIQFQRYISDHPDKAPTLLRITSMWQVHPKYANKCCSAVFKHPLSDTEISLDLVVASMHCIPAYKAMIDAFDAT